MWLAVLLITTIRVLRRMVATMRGARLSTMLSSTTTISISQAVFEPLGLFNYLTIQLYNCPPRNQGIKAKKRKATL